MRTTFQTLISFVQYCYFLRSHLPKLGLRIVLKLLATSKNPRATIFNNDLTVLENKVAKMKILNKSFQEDINIFSRTTTLFWPH
jgi:hypothetical protein